jgi:signal transduction histidine kinase
MRAKLTPLVAVAIVIVGGASTAFASMAFHMPLKDALELAGIAAGAAVGAGLIGTAALMALRRRPIGVQVALVALATVAAIGAGAMAAANAMFISAHDLDALLVIVLAAGTVGALVALVLGHRVSVAARAVGTMARRIGDGDEPGRTIAARTGELTALARELEETSARLQEARARERATEESRRELIAWVSHDLRTPLSGIQAISEALEDGLVVDPQTAGRYYRTLRIETERLAHLVDELFELSVIQAGALRLQMERVSLSDLVSDAISAASVTAGAKGVRVEGQVTGSTPELELAPPEVSRVLRNLLDNAIRHTPHDGSVWVATGLQDDGAYVSVADECGGIPEADLTRVFDMAFRGEPARTPSENGGGGLGLAIARGIVEAHHGEITVCNEGLGCRFTVRLPLTQPS